MRRGSERREERGVERRSSRARCALAAGLLAASIAAGCGGPQTAGAAFDASWVDDGGAAMAAVQQRLAQTPIAAGADVAVGIVGASTLVGVSLDGGARWTFEHPLDGRPSLAGSVVVGLGGGELFALDARTGNPLWRRTVTGRLRGAGDDGKTTIVSLIPKSGRGSTVLAIRRDGSVAREIEDEARIGVPTVVGDVAFLPWQGQYVTAYDLGEGREIARVVLRTQTSHAFASGGTLFFAEAGATRFDEKIREASAGRASTVMLPARELPGVPRWYGSGIDAPALRPSAADKIRLYARPAARGAPGIENGRFAATYYRIAVGLDAKSGQLGWVHSHDADFVGGAAYPGGFALCDAKGKVTFLEVKRGTPVGSVEIGQPVDSCLVQADGFARPPGEGAAKPLVDQLAAAIKMPEAEHVMIQKLLLRELSGMQEERVTEVLIDLASSERTPPLLLDEARKALAARRNGVPAMLAALGKRYDYLADVLRPPPVGPLADALAAAREVRAAPLLAEHLLDPATPPDDTRRAAQALVAIAGQPEVPALTTFFAQYRGLGDDEALRDAVVAVAQALVKLGAGEVVAKAAKDPYTHEALAPRIAAVAKAPGAPGAAPPKPGADAKPADVKPADAKPAAAKPN